MFQEKKPGNQVGRHHVFRNGDRDNSDGGFSFTSSDALIILIIFSLAFSGYGNVISSQPSSKITEDDTTLMQDTEGSLTDLDGKEKSIYNSSFDEWTTRGVQNEWEMGSGDPNGDDQADSDDQGPTSAHSGSNMWATDLDDNYTNYGSDSTADLVMWLKSPVINTSGFSDITIEFWDWLAVEEDYPDVVVNSTTGQSQYNLSYSVTNHEWKNQSFALNDTYEGDEIQLNFSFYVDSAIEYYGWAVDDVYMNGTESGEDSPSVIFHDDFDDWNSGGQVNQWELGAGDRKGDDAADNDSQGPTEMYSAPHGWATNLSGSYGNGTDPSKPVMWLESPTIDTEGYIELNLEFQEWLDLRGKEKGNYSIHAYSLDEGKNHSVVENHYDNHTWKKRNFSLNSSLEGDKIKLYFSLYAQNSSLDYGWAFDDIYINGTKLGVDSVEIRDGEGESAVNVTKKSVPVGYSQTFHAASFNSTYGYIENINVSWKLDNESGGAISKQVGFDSTYRAGLTGGIDHLNISYNSTYSDSVQINVDPPTIDQLEIRDGEGKSANNISSLAVPVGYEQVFHTAYFNDTAGYVDECRAEWSVNLESGGSAETGHIKNSSYTAGTFGGTDHINVTNGSFTDILQINVRSPTIDSIEIRDDNGSSADNISSIEVPVGYSNTFYSASFNDTSGFLNNTDVEWSFEGNSGGNADTGTHNESTYSAGTSAGTDHLNISYDGLTDSLQIDVKEPTVDGIEIRDEEGDPISNVSMSYGENRTLQAVPYNSTSGYLEGLEVDWIPSSDVVELSTDRGEKTKITAVENGTATIYVVYDGVENSTSVEITTEEEFAIAGEIDDLILTEDFGVHQIDLRNHIFPRYSDRLEEMYWSITGENQSIVSVSGDERTGNHAISFISKDDKYGEMEVQYTLIDGEGNRASQKAWVNVTPVNDAPVVGQSPDLYVRYEEPYSFDYSPYVSDVDDEKNDLTLTTDDEDHTVVDGLEVTYTYPEQMVGEEIYVRITISDGEKTSSDLIKITVTSNYPPENTEEIPDITLKEGEVKNNVFDLDDYITDPDNDSLYYTYGYTHLNITIDDEDHTVDVSAETEWSGTESVTFRAEDPTGAIVEQSIDVTVIPVNDPPFFREEIDPLVIHYDHPYTFDLSWYVSDPDDELDELTANTSDPENVSVDGLELTLKYPKTYEGKTNYTLPLTIYVTDGLNSSSQSIDVTVTDNYAPDLKKPLPDVQFKEDQELKNAFDLDDHFVDVDSETIFYISGNEYVNVNISENNTVSFSAPQDWNGEEEIMIRGTDEEGGYTEDYFYVRVLPVNDAPRIEDIPAQRVNRTTWILDISPYIYDVDDPEEALDISVNDSNVEVTGHKLLFNYPEPIENETVRITVSDGELSNSGEINITILEESRAEEQNDILWYAVLALSITAIAFVGMYFKGRGSYSIEDIFLIHESGTLIQYTTKTLDEETDEDILAGMFTAVQNFVKDAFAEGEKDTLKRMDYGDKTVLIHKGNHVLLAMFFTGGEPDWALDSMKNFVEDVEERYEGEIEDWSGDHEALTGVEDMVEELLEENGKYEKGDWE